MLSGNKLTNLDEFIFDDFKYLEVFQFYGNQFGEYSPKVKEAIAKLPVRGK